MNLSNIKFRSGQIPDFLLWIVRGAAVVTIAFACSWWSWKMLGPTPRISLSYTTIPQRASLVEPVVAMHLFGEPPAPVAPVVVPMPEVIVKAVFAEQGKAPGYAIMLVDKQTVIAKVKTEIRPGILLDKVEAQHVEFVRDGQPVRVPLEAGKPPAPVVFMK